MQLSSCLASYSLASIFNGCLRSGRFRTEISRYSCSGNPGRTGTALRFVNTFRSMDSVR
ncbi:hypothetical protein BIW11_13371 [Tropilaelaps mercedesae]|uniref:Uncharacterized protein n=1 Tax=Tropilaelaps mercedesae TaxID=418985 RepID=A0A1V9X2Q1_9ACAR|nr:hypothetical protein BIW11_13371 [Tropilaelaps mercedesae]